MTFSVKIEPKDDEQSDNDVEPELVIDDDHEDREGASPSSVIKVEAKELPSEGPAAQAISPRSVVVRQEPATMSDLFSSFSGPRRCETCDIKFTYLKSYLAHKEFYCKERNNNGTVVVANSGLNKASERMTTNSSPSNGLSNTAAAAVTNSRAAEVQ